MKSQFDQSPTSPVNQISYYVINLESAQDRRQFMEEQALREGVSMQFIRATTGVEWQNNKELDTYYSAKRRRRQYSYNMTPNEHACAMSHIRAYKEFLQSDKEFCCIFEDDAELLPGFKSGVEDLLSSLTGWDVVRLYVSPKVKHEPVVGICTSAGRKLSAPNTVFGMVALLYTREAVERILESIEQEGYWLQIDVQLGYIMQSLDLVVCAVDPLLVLHSSRFHSEIDADKGHCRLKDNKPKRGLRQFVAFKLLVIALSRWKKSCAQKVQRCVVSLKS